ncbi:hypothetical protein CPB83DRAFT_889078 [Crepidotus variabilis]|uniref:Uncharacterized protein n=1 Tax=Crepidotus variabilis TaxID=179855 RepID=A0A9P6EUN8_9AGAR|nr:hypothetical protein CPB83DRAFT_889078 [Crepidotus variabilis]
MALLTASINLAIRTIAIWSNVFVTAGLTLMILGNAAIIILEVYRSRASFFHGIGCTPSNPDETGLWLRAAFLYAMIFDLAVLILSVYKITMGATPTSQLVHERSIKSRIPQSRLSQILFKHGVIYYLTAFLTDLLSIIFLSLHLNVSMNNIAQPPTQVISTIAACRAVRALANFNHDNANKPVHVFDSGKTRSTSISKVSTSGLVAQGLEDPFMLVEMETVARRDTTSRLQT